MTINGFRGALGGLVLTSALLAAGTAAAQTYSTSFTGAPGSIACTNTSDTTTAGANFNWNLPSAATQLHAVVKAGATLVSDSVVPLPVLAASGTAPAVGSVGPFTSTPFPYTLTVSITPVISGATTSSFSFLCASAVGSNFTIANGAPFSTAVPTLDRWGLLLLATLLAGSVIVLFRRRLAHRAKT